MARIVTRVTSKNFCIVNPSFELSIVTDTEGVPMIQVDEGQACINGMDIIATQKLRIYHPDEVGDYYLGLHLWRDSSDNVLGDLVIGITTEFHGVYLDWYNEKDENDKDALWLGKVSWSGSEFFDLEEDKDKYGRIWAHDILCKMEDWKHPDETRMLLQDWMYKVPDWYVSKEGDVMFGPIEFLNGRDPNVEGTLDDHEDLGTGKYGVRVEVIDNNNAKIDIKAPSVSADDQNKRLTILPSSAGIEIDLGKSKLISNTTNNYDLVLTTPNNINVTSDKSVSIIGKDKVEIGTGNDGTNPKLTLNDNKATFTDSIDSNIKDEIIFASGVLKHIIGKSIFQYTTSNGILSLLGTDTNYFSIVPNTDLTNNLRVQKTIYVGDTGTFGNGTTKLTGTEWLLTDGNKTSTTIGGRMVLVDPTAGNGYFETKQNDNIYSRLSNNGSLTLHNNSVPTIITFEDGTASYNASISKTKGASELNVTVNQVNMSGNLDVAGDITATRVWNAVYNDLAEYMEKADYSEEIVAGDVVVFTADGKVTKAINAVGPDCINRLAGIVSGPDTMGYVLGGDGLTENERVPVALSGRVYLNVGELSVQSGDLIALRNNGELEIVNDYSRAVVGKATKTTENGKVYVLVK